MSTEQQADNGTRVEQVTPYADNTSAKTEQVRQMFDSIAPAYDFMNRAMTMGIDIWWRRLAVKRLKPLKPRRILDVATGTGDFAIQLSDTLRPQHITGIDLSQGMLDEASRKVKSRGLEDAISFEQGECAISSICSRAIGRWHVCSSPAACCVCWNSPPPPTG